MDLDALAVFREVADRSAPEREEYYATHQVGDDVRTEVESLLRFDSRTDDSLRVQVSSAARRVLLDSDRGEGRLPAGNDGTSPGRTLPLRSAAGADAAPADEPGSWFGPYRFGSRSAPAAWESSGWQSRNGRSAAPWPSRS